MTRRSEPLRWNDWTTRRPVRFHYEDEAARVVRLVRATARVGDPVRVGVSGVEIEGHITAVDGPTLRALSCPRAPAKKKMASERSTRPSRRRSVS